MADAPRLWFASKKHYNGVAKVKIFVKNGST